MSDPAKAPGVAPTRSDASRVVAIQPDSILQQQTYQAWDGVVPSADVDLTATATTKFPQPYARQIMVGGVGNLYVKRVNDTAFTKYAVQPGQILSGFFIAIGGSATGSTATNVTAEY